MRVEIPRLAVAIFMATACSSYPLVKRTGDRVSGPDGSDAGSGGTTAAVIDVDGSPDSAENPDAPCGATNLEATQRPVQVLLVVDSSKSMEQTPTGFSASKWAAMRAALATVLDRTKNSLSYGLELFPQGASDTSFCQMPAAAAAIGVPVAPGTGSAPQILGVFDQTAPAGGTPTAAALAGALEYFVNGVGKDLPGDKVVLLATDGGPNCNSTLTCGAARCTTNLDGLCPAIVTNCCAATGADSCLDDTRAIGAAAALLQAGIKTFVVGIPGSDVYGATLDQLAVAGGATTSYFRVGDTAGLTTVLLGITRSLINTCRLELKSGPPDPGLLNVEIDGEFVQKGPNGWQVDLTGNPWAVVLQGSTCTRVETEGAQAVRIVYGCPTVQ